MPFPIAAGVAGFAALKKLRSLNVVDIGSKITGLPKARIRGRAANKRLRMQALEEASADARRGGERGKQAYQVVAQWAGLLANGTVPMEWPQRYTGDQGNGAWPGADGSRNAALMRATELATLGAQAETPTEAAPKNGNGSARTATARGRTRKPRTYVRYDPDTGERVAGITADDPRYSEWPNRKPRAQRATSTRSTATGTTRRRRQTRTQRETNAAIRRITTEATRAGLRLTAAGAKKFASMAAAAGMSAGVAAALVVSTGLAAYFATKWVLGKIAESNDRAYQREQLALAYRKARTRWAEQQGRALTRDEQRFLGENFKQALVAFDAGVSWTPPST